MLKLTKKTITTEINAKTMVADATFHGEQSTAGREGSHEGVKESGGNGAEGSEWSGVGERWSGVGERWSGGRS